MDDNNPLKYTWLVKDLKTLIIYVVFVSTLSRQCGTKTRRCSLPRVQWWCNTLLFTKRVLKRSFSTKLLLFFFFLHSHPHLICLNFLRWLVEGWKTDLPTKKTTTVQTLKCETRKWVRCAKVVYEDERRYEATPSSVSTTCSHGSIFKVIIAFGTVVTMFVFF